MKKILKYVYPYKSRFIVVFFVSIVLSVLNLSNAWLMGRLTDAIFYRTKGIPISITWDRQAAKSLRLNLTTAKDWDESARSEIAAELDRMGLEVISVGINRNVLLVDAKAPQSFNRDLLELTGMLRRELRSKFGDLDVYVTVPEATETSKQLVLFKGAYTVFIIPVILIIVFFFTGILKFGQNFILGATGQKIIMRLRNDIYQNIQSLSLSYFEKKNSGQTGQLISRILSDIEEINYLFRSGIQDIILEPVIIIIGLTWGIILNWQLTLLFFLVFPLVAWPISYLSKKLRLANKEIMNSIAGITGVLEETLAGIKVVKAFGMEEYEISRFQRETRQNYKRTLRGLRMSQIFHPLINFTASIAIAIFVAYGGYLVINQNLSPGEFFTFSFLMSSIADPVRKVGSIFGHVPRALAAMDRVLELLNERSEVKEAANPVILPCIQGKVEFDKVSFGYHADELVLKDINLKVEPGELVALVGPSGAGKTTMINLIARFYDPVSGTIKIDDHDLRQIKLKTFRQQMGIVPQETILFRGTIAENIAYGKIDASMDEIIEAAKAANAHDFILQTPDGYGTKVGSRGVTLSGGQRQRIAIARAILRNPRILILDEATSALDTESEVLIQEALARLMKHRTSFVIAHRLSTILSADRIVVMNKGQIVEIGNHQELLAKGGLYAKLYQTQFRDQANYEIEKC
ncbi:MAG: ABC transporter ATP-binding protein [Firmicutes bacterium]|nr:ABC transporter ATP-binding protein [Bacillota bacterium]